jgi:hypothetical protein
VDEEFLAAEGHFGELFETKKTCRDFWISATCFEFMSHVGTGFCNVFELWDFGDRSRIRSAEVLKTNGLQRLEVGSGAGELEDRPDVGEGAVVAEAVGAENGEEGFAGGDLLGETVSEAGVNGGGGRNGGVGDGGGLLIRLRNPAGSHSPLGFEAIAARCPAPVV